MGIGIININRSPRLADSLSVGRVPSIIGVLNGYVTFYGGTVTVQGLKDFVNGLFPSDLIQMVSFRGQNSLSISTLNDSMCKRREQTPQNHSQQLPAQYK